MRLALGFLFITITAVVTMVLALPLLPWRTLRIKLCNYYGKVVGPVIIRVANATPVVHYRERIGAAYPAIYISNHTSTLDAFIAIWLCPVGVREDEVVVHSPMELLHIYLPAGRFDQLSDLCGGQPISAASVQYAAGVRDPLIRQIGDTIHGEMKKETSAGRILVDCLAMCGAARVALS